MKQSEPAFLTRMKAQVGFKEGPDIETKVCTMPQIAINRIEFTKSEKYIPNYSQTKLTFFVFKQK